MYMNLSCKSDDQGIMTRPGPEDAMTYDRNEFHLKMFLSKERRACTNSLHLTIYFINLTF